MMEATNSPHLLSDIEIGRQSQKQDEDLAKQTLDVVGNMLRDADKILSDLEKDDLLGEAIIRRCQELADVVGNLAQDLEGKSEDERKALAQACIQDVGNANAASSESQQQQQQQQHQELSNLTESDIIEALSGAQGLLRDVEATLRTIERREADEIADVALTVARIFLMSLRNLYRTITPQTLVAAVTQHERGATFSDRIEILEGEGTEDTTSTTIESRGIINFGALGQQQPALSNLGGQLGQNISTVGNLVSGGGVNTQDAKIMMEIEETQENSNNKDRVRVLWPPLGPAVMSACNWGKDEAAKKPLLAVALGLTLWPAAVVTALAGTPVLLADAAIQGIYNSLSNGPIVATVERGAAHVYHSARLAYLCGGLVTRQSLRIASRQVQRNGGPAKMAQKVAGMALDRAFHPIETAQMTWNGVMVGAGAVKDAAVFIQETVEREMDKDKASKMQ